MVPCLSMDRAEDRHLELAALEDAAVAVVMLAAATLRDRFAAGVAAEQVEFKDKQQRDPVTAIDRAVEALVRSELRARFPSHGILGEEGTGDAVDSSLLWVLDPIDGTANFASGLPFYGLSLALLRDGEPIVGCLYVPFWPGSGEGDLLRASRGNGARIGGSTIRLERRAFRPSGPVAVPPGPARHVRGSGCAREASGRSTQSRKHRGRDRDGRHWRVPIRRVRRPEALGCGRRRPDRARGRRCSAHLGTRSLAANSSLPCATIANQARSQRRCGTGRSRCSSRRPARPVTSGRDSRRAGHRRGPSAGLSDGDAVARDWWRKRRGKTEAGPPAQAGIGIAGRTTRVMAQS